MRGGLERWKRGAGSHGVRAAIAYALDGSCDAAMRLSSGVEALEKYSESDARAITRFTATAGEIATDDLARGELSLWIDGFDPLTGERRGRDLSTPQSDLLLDGTINAPKSFSLVALLNPELTMEFEALQDRLRDRVITTWQRELNARRGAGGRLREAIHRLEVVELQHRRSRALDPHIHRHLWLSVKVQGADGKWSNVDSRVAMRLHTLINAEGELAARTDPKWVAALARHGYTLNADGEITEVVHAVRLLSRRSNQIEANRALLLAQWRAEHPGAEPSRGILVQIDRRAWAKDRPRKPRAVHEDAWEDLVRGELAAIDAALLDERDPVTALRNPTAPDARILAAVALVDADARATASGGRFSMIDVRAGAMRAVAASGVVAPREHLQSLIDEAVHHALAETVNLLDGAQVPPQHIKTLMAAETLALKAELAERFEALNLPGATISAATIDQVAAKTLDGMPLDEEQAQAAGAIAGTNRLVTITGPAGTGKTTMLRVAKAALDLQKRRMIVVAPTKKAATVAGRAIGADASSLHALLRDHGWRWGHDLAGAERWMRLQPGEIDTATGRTYSGPQRHPLRPGDRIVVDEAGMVDLHTARALAALADTTGAGIAMVGDHLQAMPVGHSGAMGCMARRSGALVQLSSVHRFHDPAYAALTLRLRAPASRDDAFAIAAELNARGHIHAVADLQHARDVMVEGYFRATAARHRVALVTNTNEEADQVNEAIQQRRLDAGHLTLRRIAWGMKEQRILEGDTVQTRRNDTATGVENRAMWTVRRIHLDRIELTSIADTTDTRTITLGYASEHLHLAYASTVHGIQGETTDVAITGPGVDAAGLYVGMTRGRTHNEAIALITPRQTAVEVIADTMLRGRPEISVDDSREAARADLARAARQASPAQPHLEEVDQLETWIRSATHAASLATSLSATSAASTHGRGGVQPADTANADALLDAIERGRALRDHAVRTFIEGGRTLPAERQPDVWTPAQPRHGGLAR